jgi:hypothetical protein
MMEPKADAGIDSTYADYLRTAKMIFDEGKKVAKPYMVVAAVALVLGAGSCYLGMSSLQSRHVVGPFYANTYSWLFWIGVISGLVLEFIGAFKADRAVKREIADAIKSRPGFDLFYKGLRSWYQEPPVGKKLEEFKAIIGKTA